MKKIKFEPIIDREFTYTVPHAGDVVRLMVSAGYCYNSEKSQLWYRVEAHTKTDALVAMSRDLSTALHKVAAYTEALWSLPLRDAMIRLVMAWDLAFCEQLQEGVFESDE